MQLSQSWTPLYSEVQDCDLFSEEAFPESEYKFKSSAFFGPVTDPHQKNNNKRVNVIILFHKDKYLTAIHGLTSKSKQ